MFFYKYFLNAAKETEVCTCTMSNNKQLNKKYIKKEKGTIQQTFDDPYRISQVIF